NHPCGRSDRRSGSRADPASPPSTRPRRLQPGRDRSGCDLRSPTTTGRGGLKEVAMSPLSRGFHGRRPAVDATRVPPGQYVTSDFPVLSAGPTPHTPLDEWSFTISGAVDEPVSWPWEELIALPAETPTVDIHCVTKWSNLDTAWRGVSIDTLLDGVHTEGAYVR